MLAQLLLLFSIVTSPVGSFSSAKSFSATDATVGTIASTDPSRSISRTIDLGDYEVVFDPVTGEPLLRSASLIDGRWDGRFGSAGLTLDVFDMAADAEGNVYVVGPLVAVGGIPTDKIAMWDGTGWDGLGSGSSTGFSLAVAVGPDGKVYVGGAFDEIRGVPAKGIAVWDGVSWSAVGSGLDNLTVGTDFSTTNEWIGALEFGEDGTLYAGGLFSSIDGVAANNIAMFDGTSWTAMDDGTSGEVQTIAVSSDNVVYAAGEFGDFNESGTFYEKIVSWNGTVWSTLMHVTGPVIDIAVRGSASVFVGGDFVHMVPDIEDGSAIEVNRFIYSDNSGGSWNAIGAGEDIGFERSGAAVNGAEVFGIKIGSDNNVYVVGDFDTVAGQEAWDAAFWDGSTWTALGGGVDIGLDDSEVHALIETEAGWFLGGQFVSVGDLKGVRSIAQWTGETWAALGGGLGYLPGLSGAASNIKIGPDGNVYVSGTFVSAGGVTTDGTAYWDGLRWNAFGETFNQPVRDIAIAPDGTVYAVGTFVRPNFTTFPVAMWDGSAWVEVGDITTFANIPPMEMQIDSQGNVYVAGAAVQTINGNAVTGNGGLAHIVMWDGTEWSIPGDGVDNVVTVIHLDDSDNLYVGGKFDEAGGTPARGIAMWDGTSWNSFGLGFRDDVKAIAIAADGTLYAGGEFEATDFQNPIDPNSGVPALRVAMWDGSAWSQVGEGLNDKVNALEFDDEGVLYAAGVFTADGTESTTLNRIAAWDGSSWTALGGGFDRDADALAFHSEHGLFVGGTFSLANGASIEEGAIPSAGIALFHPGGTGSTDTEERPDLASVLSLSNYPNPFTDQTTIEFELETDALARVDVFDLLGRRVSTLVDARLPIGTHAVNWNAEGLASGRYIVRIVADGKTATRIAVRR